MELLFFGIPFLVASMAVVMITPCCYYMKRDMKWNASENKTLELWYS